MKKFKMLMMLMGILAMSLMTTGCDDDNDDPTPKPQEKKAKFLICTTVKNADGMSGTSYMQLISDFSGSIDNSQAKQINFGVGVGVRGKYIYSFPTFGKDGNPNLEKYTYTETTDFGSPQSLLLPSNSGASNIVMINEEKAYLSSYNIGMVVIINPKTMKKIGQIDLSQYAYSDNNPDPANAIIRDGLYYLCLDQVNQKYMPYEDHRQVDVLVIDPKTDKVLKIIEEKSSNLSFPTRPMDNTKGMIFTDEKNDMYIACVGNFGFDPTYKNNGFVCIPSGQQVFDESKTWDMSNTPIQGTEYKPATIYNCQYIGNHKVVAYVGIFELIDFEKPYTSRNAMAVLIDLKAKTIKKIDGVPLTDGHSVSINRYKDLVVIGSYGKDKVGFFTYNPKTEEVKLALETVGNPIDFYYFE